MTKQWETFRGQSGEPNEAWQAGNALINRKGLRHDPRPELEEDTELWRALLEKADDLDGNDPLGLFGALHGLRCLGASLTRVDGRVVLGHGRMSEAEYLEERNTWLLPHRENLVKMLGEI